MTTNINGYTISTFYQGITTYVVEKDGKEVYYGWSAGEIKERFGIDLNEAQ